jgi:hypothetical protein
MLKMCVHNNSAKFGECQPKGVRERSSLYKVGTQYEDATLSPSRLASNILLPECTLCNLAKNPYGGLFLPCLQTSQHPFTRYEI